MNGQASEPFTGSKKVLLAAHHCAMHKDVFMSDLDRLVARYVFDEGRDGAQYWKASLVRVSQASRLRLAKSPRYV